MAKLRVQLLAYQGQIKPYRTARRAYMLDQYLRVLEETLPEIWKYVSGIDRNRLEIRLRLEQESAGLEQILGKEEKDN